ncbi:hypothetical protein ACPYO6_15710 [Georgenia sp. Z1344]|uniref:hypothetical protein n=1 Tax=Georgenia sp. Z1344 TaxID=3416706 RepID=UPI003CEC8F96
MRSDVRTTTTTTDVSLRARATRRPAALALVLAPALLLGACGSSDDSADAEPEPEAVAPPDEATGAPSAEAEAPAESGSADANIDTPSDGASAPPDWDPLTVTDMEGTELSPGWVAGLGSSTATELPGAGRELPSEVDDDTRRTDVAPAPDGGVVAWHVTGTDEDADHTMVREDEDGTIEEIPYTLEDDTDIGVAEAHLTDVGDDGTIAWLATSSEGWRVMSLGPDAGAAVELVSSVDGDIEEPSGLRVSDGGVVVQDGTDALYLLLTGETPTELPATAGPGGWDVVGSTLVSAEVTDAGVEVSTVDLSSSPDGILVEDSRATIESDAADPQAQVSAGGDHASVDVVDGAAGDPLGTVVLSTTDGTYTGAVAPGSGTVSSVVVDGALWSGLATSDESGGASTGGGLFAIDLADGAVTGYDEGRGHTGLRAAGTTLLSTLGSGEDGDTRFAWSAS